MDTLNIEPTYQVVLGDVKHFRIMLIGAGGTGLYPVAVSSWFDVSRPAEGYPG